MVPFLHRSSFLKTCTFQFLFQSVSLISVSLIPAKSYEDQTVNMRTYSGHLWKVCSSFSYITSSLSSTRNTTGISNTSDTGMVFLSVPIVWALPASSQISRLLPFTWTEAQSDPLAQFPPLQILTIPQHTEHWGEGTQFIRANTPSIVCVQFPLKDSKAFLILT